MENAIREGVIYWHAFPFNGQLEIMDEPLIRSAIHTTHALDKKFGYLPKRTLSQAYPSSLNLEFLLLIAAYLSYGCCCVSPALLALERKPVFGEDNLKVPS